MMGANVDLETEYWNVFKIQITKPKFMDIFKIYLADI